MDPRSLCRSAALAGVCAVAWIGGAALTRGPARAAEPAASGPAIRHQFLNNLDARRQVPNDRGYISVSFKTLLPSAPTIILQCANPRYVAKVHGATAAGFLFALYRTQDTLRGDRNDPFNGSTAAKPVTDFRDGDNIDVAWVAIAE